MSSIETLDPNFASADPEQGLCWYNVLDLGLEGRGFTDTAAPYDRLPARAEGVVPENVWRLSRLSAGLSVRFVTDAPSIAVRWTVTREPLTMPHMAATGGSGLDLYVEQDGAWRFTGVARPREFPHNEDVFIRSMTPARRHYRAYLPLYNGVAKAELGIPRECALARAPAWPADRARPIVFYGTSIDHGGCASRPGMCHPSILGRRLNRPVINLGFSGNGKAEPEVARLVAEIDAAVFVVNPLGNIDDQVARERLGPFVRILREAHPDTPIVLPEHFTHPSDALVPWQQQARKAFREVVAETVARLREDGIENLHVLDGETLYDAAGEGTVDGTHPTDLGFMHMAGAYEPLLSRLL